MHEQFLAAGIAVAGMDAGEAYGSPKSHELFNAFYDEITSKRGFAKKCCLLGRSRGGLWVSSWAIAFPARVAGLAGIYPVFDFRTYPGITNAAPAYELTPAELDVRAAEFNPILRIGELAQAGIPAILIHGDADKVVPLKENSADFLRRYQEAGVGHWSNSSCSKVKVITTLKVFSIHRNWWTSLLLAPGRVRVFDRTREEVCSGAHNGYAA